MSDDQDLGSQPETIEDNDAATGGTITEEEQAAIWDELAESHEGAESSTYTDVTSEDVTDDENEDSADFEAEDDQIAANTDDASDGHDSDAEVSDAESDPSETSSTQQEDVWAGATPEQLSAIEAERQEWKTRNERARGQASGLQRRINQLEAQLAQQQQQEAQGEQQPNNDFLNSDHWKQFEDDYEEVAAPISQVIGGQQAKIDKLEQMVKELSNDRKQEKLNDFYNAEGQHLAQEHPDYSSVFEQNQEAFVDWYNSAPKIVQEAAMRNSDTIVDANEAAFIVSSFKSYLAAQGSSQETQTRAPSSNAGNNNRLSEKGKKDRLLKSAKTPSKGRRPPAATGIPEDGDPQQIWDALDREYHRKHKHL